MLGAVTSLQDDVLECAAVGKEANTRAKFISLPSRPARTCVRACVRAFSITSQPLGQGERVHGGPVVGRVLRLLRGLLVQVVHGAQGVHGVQGVAVHPVVLHGERPLPAERSAHHERQGPGCGAAFILAASGRSLTCARTCVIH